MVLYFSPTAHKEGSDDWLIYMGKDKFENEELIRYGLPEDVWFHVDNLSSAHVYLRLPRGKAIDDIPEDLLEECCQLVKQNSIQGCKDNNVPIVYTMWGNLKKTADMVVGQVSFHKQKAVKRCVVERKKNDILNRINKTRREEFPDLAAQREAYESDVSRIKKRELQEQKVREKAEAEGKQRANDLQNYKNCFDGEAMTSNREVAAKYETAEDFEDDFM